MNVFRSRERLDRTISRDCIRKAQNEAITELNANLAAEEPQQEAEVALDHDRNFASR